MPLNAVDLPPFSELRNLYWNYTRAETQLREGGSKVKRRASALVSSLDTIGMPQVVQFVKRGVLPANLASYSVVSRKVL